MRLANGPMIDDSDVVVIGGGVTGCAAAYELAKAGAAVTLVERYDLNTQASGRNAGGLHGQIQHDPFVELGEGWARAFGPTLALMRAAIERWRGLGDELGADLEVNVSGGLIVAATGAQLRDLERKAAIERQFGNEVELLGRAELSRVAPYVSERMAGGLLCELEGKANPLLAAPALAKAALDRGARILLQTDVLAVEPGFTVATTAGPIRCGRIVDCRGVDVGSLSGIELPAERWPIQVSVTEAVPPLVSHLVYFAGEKLTLKQAKVGSLLIGGGWPSREVDGRLAVDVASLAPNLRLAVEVVPRVAGASLLRTWAGVCPGIADQRPVIGELVPGWFVAMFPFLGFTGGPLLGQIAARLAIGDDPGLDLAPFDPHRFG